MLSKCAKMLSGQEKIFVINWIGKNLKKCLYCILFVIKKSIYYLVRYTYKYKYLYMIKWKHSSALFKKYAWLKAL